MRTVAIVLLLTACGPREAQVINGGSCSDGCGANERCDEGTDQCVCASGFARRGGTCVAGANIDPTDRSRAGVCAQWNEGHRVSTPSSFTPGATECDPGSLAPGAIGDTIARIDMFRWFAGMGGVDHDASYDADAQACATIAAFWDFARPVSPHTPPADSRCFSVAGQRGAGTSNISWGTSHPANTIDGFIEDPGANNVDALGHRRWILNPPLGRVGIGYYEGGTNFGVASCLRVFDTSGGGAAPRWNAVPPAGFAPIDMTRWTWSFQGSIPGIPDANVTMEDAEGEPLAIEVRRLQAGFAEDSVSWVPVGWRAMPDVTYTVRINGLVGGEVSYEVTPVVCN